MMLPRSSDFSSCSRANCDTRIATMGVSTLLPKFLTRCCNSKAVMFYTVVVIISMKVFSSRFSARWITLYFFLPSIRPFYMNMSTPCGCSPDCLPHWLVLQVHCVDPQSLLCNVMLLCMYHRGKTCGPDFNVFRLSCLG